MFHCVSHVFTGKLSEKQVTRQFSAKQRTNSANIHTAHAQIRMAADKSEKLNKEKRTDL